MYENGYEDNIVKMDMEWWSEKNVRKNVHENNKVKMCMKIIQWK